MPLAALTPAAGAATRTSRGESLDLGGHEDPGATPASAPGGLSLLLDLGLRLKEERSADNILREMQGVSPVAAAAAQQQPLPPPLRPSSAAAPPPQADSAELVRHTGTLWKLGQGLGITSLVFGAAARRWTHRYFVLAGRSLSWYASAASASAGSKALGSLPLIALPPAERLASLLQLNAAAVAAALLAKASPSAHVTAEALKAALSSDAFPAAFFARLRAEGTLAFPRLGLEPSLLECSGSSGGASGGVAGPAPLPGSEREAALYTIIASMVAGQGAGLPRECAEVAARSGLAPITLLTTQDRSLVVAAESHEDLGTWTQAIAELVRNEQSRLLVMARWDREGVAALALRLALPAGAPGAASPHPSPRPFGFQKPTSPRPLQGAATPSFGAKPPKPSGPPPTLAGPEPAAASPASRKAADAAAPPQPTPSSAELHTSPLAATPATAAAACARQEHPPDALVVSLSSPSAPTSEPTSAPAQAAAASEAAPAPTAAAPPGPFSEEDAGSSAESEKGEAGEGEEGAGLWDLRLDEVEIVSRIGSGAHGDVYKGLFCGSTVAIKLLKKTSVAPEELQALRREVEVLSALRHPNCVLFLGAGLQPPAVFIVMEHCELGSLADLLYDRSQPLSSTVRLSVALQAAQGMAYLHAPRRRIIHRDLKSANLLVKRDLTVQVADFGVTIVKGGQGGEARAGGGSSSTSTPPLRGTPQWMAPELLEGGDFTESVDIYSFGITLCEIVARILPFSDRYARFDFIDAVLRRGPCPPSPCGSRRQCAPPSPLPLRGGARTLMM